jgi:hypothetical protein
LEVREDFVDQRGEIMNDSQRVLVCQTPGCGSTDLEITDPRMWRQTRSFSTGLGTHAIVSVDIPIADYVCSNGHTGVIETGDP